jgi:hypothetical protein
MKPHVFLSLVAGLILAGTAQAQQVVSYFSDIPRTSTNWTQTFQLPSFDSTLGTLTQVKFTYSGEVLQSVYAENIGSVGTPFDLTSTTTVGISKNGGPSLSSTPVSLHRTGNLASYDGNFDFAGTSGVSYNSDVTFGGVYLDSNLASYLSGTPIDFIASATGVGSLIAGGNSQTGQSSEAAANLKVEYTYTAIPEPSIYALLLGAIVLGIVTIRRQKVASLD